MQLRERLAYAGVVSRQKPPQPRELRPPAGFERGSNRLGEVYYRDRYLPLDYKHGRVRLSSALALDGALLERLGDGLTLDHVRNAAFVDIETTGLSGGTGTYAFLVGVGTFDALSFRVRQFFLAEPGGEPAMLSAIAETVNRCEALVSFNGKSFDLPQLGTRYALSRLPPLAEGLPHIDLLHPCRRLFGRTLESCRLAEIERALLGLHRREDVASWMIPELYFRYMRRNEAAGLHPVFEHNHLDVVSLVAVLAYLNKAAGREASGDVARLLALARWDEARGRRDDARVLYEDAWRLDPEGEDGGVSLFLLARLVRRSGEWHRCQGLWHEELHTTGSKRRQIRAYEELAKIAEHREHDPEKALDLAMTALSILEATPNLSRLLPLTHTRLQYRLARLERRTAGKVGDAALLKTQT